MVLSPRLFISCAPIFLSLLGSTLSFSSMLNPHLGCFISNSCLFVVDPQNYNNRNKKITPPTTFNRQEFLSELAVLATFATSTAIPLVSNAAVNGGNGPDRPVAVLGASGRAGMEVVRALANEGLYTVSMTRTGIDPYRVVKLPEATKAYITHYPEKVNVVAQQSVEDAIAATHASAIIFCASASKQGGTAFEVDDQGVGNAAMVAKKLGARLVVISALAVDRPDSKSFQITNTLGGNLNGIMDAKLQGEEKVRKILSGTKDYVIVRPGVLLNGKSTLGLGVNGVEVNQGDTVGGGLSRDELAGVVVGALKSGIKGTTVEVYRRSTATKLQPEFVVPSGREKTANSYPALFAGLELDK